MWKNFWSCLSVASQRTGGVIKEAVSSWEERLSSCRGTLLLRAPLQGSWKGLKHLLRNTHECLHCEAQPSSLANVVHNLLRPWAS